MSYPHSISRALAAVQRRKGLALFQLAANAVLGVAAYGWLLIPEAAAWQVAASAVLAVALLCAFLVLHGGTLRVFAEANDAGGATWPAFAGAARRLPALFVWLTILIAGRELLYLGDEEGWGVIIASWLTLTFRRPFAPPDVLAWLLRLQAALDWMWLALWLPGAREVVLHGLAAFRSRRRAWCATITSLAYWIVVVVLLAAGAWLPALLVNWVPEVRGLWMEFSSLLLRFVPALALALVSWLTLLALVAQPAATPEKN
jgi:hypothetical protein